MVFLVFIPPNGFNDEALATVKMFFERWNVGYKITSYSNKACVGTHGASYTPDINTMRASYADFDGIILINGKGVDSYRLPEFRPLLDLVMQFHQAKKIVCAIANSIQIIARANIINGKKVAVPQDDNVRRQVLLFHGIPTDSSEEIADNLITIKDNDCLDSAMPKLLERIGVV